MKKIMFISNRLRQENKNGANVVSKRNFENLLDIYGEKNIFFKYIRPKKRIRILLDEFFLNRMESISLIDEKKICEEIKHKNIKTVFLDTSCYGFLAEKIKKKFNNKVKIITFCHDINKCLMESLLLEEKIKFKKLLRIKNTLKNSPINEKLSFENSDIVITLNERDAQLLKKEYDINSNIDIPVTFPIKKFEFEEKNIFDENKISLLFVGVGGFIPNMNGLDFFINEVLPKIDAKLYIVGKDMENHKKRFQNEKVEIIGTVDNLDKYYLNADIVVAPIFLGGGMKVKTAEALMYGKTIFGTTEAFEGYELDYDKVGGLCNTADEFIEKINGYIKKYTGLKQNKYSKDIFIKKYSYEASKILFEKVLKEL